MIASCLSKPIFFSLSLAFFLCASELSSGTAAAQEDSLQFRGAFTWINAAVYLRPDGDSPFNPQNTILSIPQAQLISELKPDFKLTSQNLALIARPRVRLMASEVENAGQKQELTGKSEGWLSEAYAQWNLSDQVLFAYGMQNFQWGAAEALSPSNRLFHETAQERTVLYDVQGKMLARMNISFGKALSLVIMSEFEDAKGGRNETAFVYGEPFETTTLAKAEYAWNAGADYVGLVVGGREHGNPWVGQYFSWGLPFVPGVSLYADASQQRGSRAYYPQRREIPVGLETSVSLIELEQTRKDPATKDDPFIINLAVAGARYDFESGGIARVEYVHNGAGWTESERADVLTALTSTAPAQLALREQNLSRALAPGLELPGRRYLFISYAAPGFFSVQDWDIYLRALHSLTDQSTSSYISSEYGIGDAGTAFAALAASSDKLNSELRALASPTATVGYRHAW